MNTTRRILAHLYDATTYSVMAAVAVADTCAGAYRWGRESWADALDRYDTKHASAPNLPGVDDL